MESRGLISAPQESARRFAQVGDLFMGLVKAWRPTLLLVLSVPYCWHERFWRDSAMRVTCPLLLFLLSLPILDHYGFSFAELFRKHKASIWL